MESQKGSSEPDLTIADVLGPMAAIFNFDLREPGVIDLYETSLAKIDLDLLHVTVSALMEELDWMPRPAAIIRKAKAIEAESSDKPAEEEHWRKDSYDCPTCRDTGYVSIWTPDAMRWALSQAGKRTYATEPRRCLTEAAAKCTCSRGQSRGGSAATYDERLQLRVQPGSVKTKIESLMKWANQWQPANYVDAFESY